MPLTKHCSTCEVEKPVVDFGKRSNARDGLQPFCKACAATINRENNYRNKYGITIAEYDAMFAKQEGLCAICQRPSPEKRLAVDHNHQTGKVRGLLCMNCNRYVLPALEYRKDLWQVMAAIRYLDEHN